MYKRPPIYEAKKLVKRVSYTWENKVGKIGYETTLDVDIGFSEEYILKYVISVFIFVQICFGKSFCKNGLC